MSNKPKSLTCPECISSRIWKDGIRYTRNGEVQRYICRSCGYRFSETKVKLDILSKPVKLLDPTADLADVVVGQTKFSLEKPLNIPSLFRSENVASHGSSNVSAVEKDLNPSHIYSRDRQVCVALAEGTKNLAEVKSRTKKRAAGATKPSEADIKGKLIEYIWYLKREGYAESTIRTNTVLMKRLLKRGANLLDPRSVKGVLAKQEAWSGGYKRSFVQAYKIFAKINAIPFKSPKYKQTQKLPFIPTEKEIDQLIAGCGPKTATLLQLLKETGMRSGEAWQLEWIDINTANNTIRVTAEKNSNPRMFRVSDKLISMLNQLPKRRDKVFGNTFLRSQRNNFYLQRKRIAKKLQNPRIQRISFHTLRHWKATTEYHKTKDILHVKQLLGHKNINNTLIYTHLVNFESDQYHCRVAKTLEEAKSLIEAGFEYVTDMDDTKLFRKPK